MGTPAENIPTTDQLTGKLLRILKDFTLQRGVEGLCQGVVSTGTDRSHRLPDSQLRARLLERVRGIDGEFNRSLEDRPLQATPGPGRILECLLDQGRAHVVGDRPPDHPAGVHVDDGGQIQEFPVPTRQVGDVTAIDLMAGLGGELAFHEVVEDACPPVLDRGLPGFTQVHADGVALPHEPFHALVVDRLG